MILKPTRQRKYRRPIDFPEWLEFEIDSFLEHYPGEVFPERISAEDTQRLDALRDACSGLLTTAASDTPYEAAKKMWLPTFTRLAQAARVEVSRTERYWRQSAEEPVPSFDLQYACGSLDLAFASTYARIVSSVIDWFSRERACPVCGNLLGGKISAKYCGAGCSSYAYRQRRDAGSE